MQQGAAQRVGQEGDRLARRRQDQTRADHADRDQRPRDHGSIGDAASHHLDADACAVRGPFQHVYRAQCADFDRLHHEDGASVEDLAQRLGLGFETAKSRLRYALQKLRGCMRRYLEVLEQPA